MASPTRSRSLSRLLFGTTLVAALLPAGLLGAWLVLDVSGTGAAPDDPGTNRAVAEAVAVRDALERWLGDQERILRAWGEAPSVVEGVRLAAVEHHELGYTEQTPEEVNALLVHKRHLGLAAAAEEYLTAQVALSDAWAQVHFSDEYGFTVGVAGLEEDFVQTDESWWQAAWSRGRYEGPIAFDENAGGFGLRLALRIEDPATNAAVGVIDGIIAVSAIQSFTDAFTREGSSSVRILNEAGQLVSETETGHARDRILRLSSETLAAEPWRRGVGARGHLGGSRENGVERGWARLAESEGAHQDWIVVVERAAAGAMTRIGTLIAVAAALALAVLLGVGSAVWQRRRIVFRVAALAGLAERFSRGDVGEAVADQGNDEIGELGRSLERLRRTSAQALQIIGRARREQPQAAR